MSKQIGGYVGAKPTWTTVSTSGVFSLRDVKKLKADAQWPRGPEAPTNLVATAGGEQVVLTWSPPENSHGQITEYVVRISWPIQSGVSWIESSAGTDTTKTFAGLTNGTTYTLSVVAINHTQGDWSATVTATPFAPVITITSQPTNETTSIGAATFSIAATVTGGAFLSFQWQKQEGGVGAFTNIGGATIATTSLYLSNLTNAADSGDVYRCVVSATGGATSVTSNSAVLTVNEAITITSQPSNQTASSGAATFSISAVVTGGESLSYQWQKQESASGSFANISGATSSSLALSGLTNADDNGDVYRCVVSATGGAQSVTSSGATLTVPAAPGSAPVLLATFDVARVVDSGPNNYWLDGAQGYYDIAAGDSYGDTDPVVSRSPYVAGKYSTYALVTGDNTQTFFSSGGRQLGVGVIGKAGVGAAHLNAQLISSSFTMEAWIKPTVALADKDPNNYYHFVERYLRVGPWTLTGVSAYADNWSNPLYDPNTLTGPVCTVLKSDSGFIANAHSLTVLTANFWNHVAFVRDVSANELRVYLNGALIITAADDPAWALSSAWPSYGSIIFSHYYNERMYYDQCRIMPGAIYSGATITPPAAGFSYTRSPAPAATTELLLNATHGLEDWGARAGEVVSRRRTSPSGFDQPSVSTSVAKWGAASYVFGDENGWSSPGRGMQLRGNIQEWMYGQSGDYLSTLMAVLNNGPWTIEAWVRPMASISYSASPESYAYTDGETYMTCSFWDSIITVYDNTISVPGAGSYANPVAISAGTTLEFFHRYEGIDTSYRVTAPTSLARNQWHHIAVVADVANNLLRLKINGAEVGTIDISQTWSNKGAAYGGDLLYFGGTYDFSYGNAYPAYGFKGYMDDIRVSSAALYGTGSYAVPTAPLT